jgi:hypothetical protein
MRKLLLGVVMFSSALGATQCCHSGICQNDCHACYSELQTARGMAVYDLSKKYKSCFPPDYNEAAFMRDVQAVPSKKNHAEVLKSMKLEVWAEDDCQGYVLVARCPATNQIMFWDKSSTMSTIDGPMFSDPNSPPPPVHGSPPAACACAAAPKP